MSTKIYVNFPKMYVLCHILGATRDHEWLRIFAEAEIQWPPLTEFWTSGLVRPTVGALLSFCKAPALGHRWKQKVVLNERPVVEARPYER